MQNLVLDCRIMFVTFFIAYNSYAGGLHTEADVIAVEMGFTAPQQFLGHMECSWLS